MREAAQRVSTGLTQSMPGPQQEKGGQAEGDCRAEGWENFRGSMWMCWNPTHLVWTVTGLPCILWGLNAIPLALGLSNA